MSWCLESVPVPQHRASSNLKKGVNFGLRLTLEVTHGSLCPILASKYNAGYFVLTKYLAFWWICPSPLSFASLRQFLFSTPRGLP